MALRESAATGASEAAIAGLSGGMGADLWEA